MDCCESCTLSTVACNKGTQLKYCVVMTKIIFVKKKQLLKKHVYSTQLEEENMTFV